MKFTLLLFSLFCSSTFAEDLRVVMWAFKIDSKAHEVPRVVEVPVELETDYGYMVLNVGTTKEPKPHYVLGERKEGVVRHFKTKAEFLKALEVLEPNSELAHYSRCTIPSDYGLQEADKPYGEIVEICKRRKVKISDKTYRRCLCRDVADSKR